MKESKIECVQNIQHDEKHKLFLLEGHKNDIPFDHFHNLEKHIWQSRKRRQLTILYLWTKNKPSRTKDFQRRRTTDRIIQFLERK